MLSRLFINLFDKLSYFVLLLICIFTYLYSFIIVINIKYSNKLWGIIKQKYSYLSIYMNYLKYIILYILIVVGIKCIIKNDKIKIINKEDIYYFNI